MVAQSTRLTSSTYCTRSARRRLTCSCTASTPANSPTRLRSNSHERMTELKIRFLGDRVARRTAWRIAREHNWTTIRDAEYVAIAKLQADALIATDPELAAKASGLVPLSAVSDVFVP